MNYAEVQIQDHSLNWITVSNVEDNLQRVGFELRAVQSLAKCKCCGRTPLL
ncbi:hypothetical protein SAMN05443247_00017 [Bradyrhizobium erythrophlei]|jgi:hypothetical protein|nr:hypothetical protein SAMN05443247_00017 [Bradyrhizobium erythrophlei]